MAAQNDQYTNHSGQVLQNSQELVRCLRHNQLDMEHILLALLELEDGVPTRIMTELGAPSGEIRAALNQALDSAPKLTHEGNQIYLTPRAQRLLENAKAEASWLNDEFRRIHRNRPPVRRGHHGARRPLGWAAAGPWR